MEQIKNTLKALLGENLFNEVVSAVRLELLTEVRIRLNKNIAVRNRSERILLNLVADGTLLQNIVAKATNFSLYAYQHEMAEGYIRCNGGIRIGLAGRGVHEGGRTQAFKDISGLNIRIPHEIIGCSSPLQGLLNNFKNTIIVAPPFAGKTTLIRDMARVLSDKHDVTVIDEREEIAGGLGANYELGRFCDVISGVPKAYAYEGALRALSPEIIVLDELFPLKDLSAVQDIARSGVKFLASVHGDSIDSFRHKFKELAELFSCGVLLSYKPRVGSIESIVRW
ncbi:MAG: hypothetical protein FWD49_05375 [Firmicutes bacterium]|nr:hypothetical protein [Bacillota bacterium]